MFSQIARQPIFNQRKSVYAYELLFRQSMGRTLGEIDGDQATSSLLSSAFLMEEITQISGGKPCFVNFTENLLLQEIAPSFPKEQIVIEILEDVTPSPEVIAACRSLSEQGYTLALDDFVYRSDLTPLIEVADIIKVDYRLSSPEEIVRMLERLAPFNLDFLAEKVETYEEFEQAAELGFRYFQGYFFAKPESLQIKELTSNKANLLNLLAEISRPQISTKKLEQIIATDVALTYKLLRYLNSVAFSLVKKIDTVFQAIVYLGEQEIRRFITLVIVSELASDKPTELMRLSMVRARFCQRLAEAATAGHDPDEVFLLGLFSLIDAMLDTPMEQVMNKLPLAGPVVEALTSRQGALAPYLETAIAYEQADPDSCLLLLEPLGVPPETLYPTYLEAISFANILG
ncbi:MAG: EAL and HDOD domain-containing protein [Desulfobulbus sp.]|jgi:c-di-GMP-related signal transduction protein